MNEETGKVYRKLEEIISIWCYCRLFNHFE